MRIARGSSFAALWQSSFACYADGTNKPDMAAAVRSPPAPRFCPPIRRRANGLPGPGNPHSDQPRQCQHHLRKLDDTCFGYDLVVAQLLQEVAANCISEQR